MYDSNRVYWRIAIGQRGATPKPLVRFWNRASVSSEQLEQERLRQEMMSAMKSAEDGHRPAYETAASKITALISSTGLKPGDRLPTEHELSEQLGVSRTVVREAVKVLVATGLVYTRRGSGLYVANKAPSLATTMLDSLTPADPTQVISLYEFRIMLEPQAARLAAE